MILLKKNAFEFDRIAAGGYVISEEQPIVIAEITTASGYARRSYAKNSITTITVTLDSLNEEEIATYLAQLNNEIEEFTFWSIKHKRYRKALFLVDISEVPVLSGVGDKHFEPYTLTLTQCGQVSDSV